ncbi:FtsX-like permease family protein [uncultured Phenylobacterium sp.]|uniref:ABC transporter permease n=1 Tax=uncultured Phenylobacterium sp. TaxID=349273 RepID=UPI0025D2F43F|nr:FtsX-like permease family protein [uncultured Phenylobacterium sp.]
MLVALAWRNLWRRPQRTILSLLSIALVSTLLVCVVSFQTAVYGVMKETTLRIFTGYAQLQPLGYADDPGLERTIARPEDLAREATMIDGVTAAAPRVNGFAILANGERSYGAAVVGVDPASEAQISSIGSMIREGRYLAPGDSDAAILGDILARNLGVTVGSKVTVLGSGRDGSVSADVLRVVGIYHSGIPELDRSILEMPLARAQETFAMSGFANTIALGGATLEGVNNAMPALQELARKQGVIVRDWGSMEPAMRDGITLKIATSMMFFLTLVVVVAFIILNTLLMSVLERTREFGMLLAVGMQPHMIGRMVWIELVGLALVGCGAGLAIGGGITLWLQHQGVLIPGMADLLSQFGLPPRLYPALSPLSALIGPGAIFVAILIGGIVPYLRVARLTPALAMRGA